MTNAMAMAARCGTRIGGLLVLSVLSGGAAAQATLLSDSFESYAAGSNLVGQNGWVSQHGPGLLLGPASNLSTQVLDGKLFPGSAVESLIARPFASAIDPTKVTRLTVDVYAQSAVSANNSYFGFDVAGGAEENLAVDGAYWQVDQRGPGWLLNVAPVTGLDFAAVRQDIPGGTGAAVKLGIVADGVANEIYGIYDFGSGWQQTAHFPISTAQIAGITGAGVAIDYRYGATQIEYDNLLVQTVPEPATYALWLAGIAGLGLMRARRAA